MKMRCKLRHRVAFAIMILLLGLTPRGTADDITALNLVKEGNRYVGEPAQNRIIEIRSDKSIGGLVPAIWTVVYHDTTATFNATEVKFGAGKMMSVKRPFRLFEMILNDNQALDTSKVKLDSDQAIAVAAKEPLLDKLTVTATQLRLERWQGSPVWRVRLWAAKLANPNKQVELGEVLVSADDGKVLKTDFNIRRAD